MNSIENLSRRDFLRGSLSAGGFVLGVHLLRPAEILASEISQINIGQLQPSVYLAIHSDGGVLIIGASLGDGARCAHIVAAHYR
jgi:hypothetical protein